jgi:Ca2+-binding RTX toxin-like protein
MANIVGNNSNNILNGTIFADIIAGQGGNDTLNGGFGNDTLKGGLGTDTLNGGLGTDTADYSNGFVDPTGPVGPIFTIGATAGVNVNLNLAGFQNTGGAGLDRLVSIENLTGTNFNDTLIGNGADNVLSGLGGNDVLSGNAGNDRLSGGTGNDQLNGGIGNDTLNGDAGNDRLDGWTGNDILNGGSGNDTLLGWTGNDRLNGGSGNDTLNGEAGNDHLTGGTGRDVLTGGGGTLAFDTFDYNSTSESGPGVLSRDVITDFNGRGVLQGDQIDLRTIDANPFVAGNQAFIWGGAWTVGHARYVGGVLQVNTDFDAAAEMEIQLTGAPGLFVSANPLLQGVTDVLL